MVHPKLCFIFKIIIDIETIFFESQKKKYLCSYNHIYCARGENRKADSQYFARVILENE